jgi:signal transduction histidine kinase
MLGFVEQLKNRSRFALIAFAFLIIGIVGLIDYLTGHEISFSVFYLLGVSLAVWFVGKWCGALVSVLSVAVWVAGDIASGARFSSPLIPIWNAAILLTFYLIVVWLLARLRTFHQNLEEQVQQRTVALTDEMAERERLERELLDISEREQRRIGQDLHDGLCQHLTGATLAGQVLEEKLAALKLSEAGDANKVVGIMEEAINLSRRLAKGLYPVEMEADGLMLALEEFASTSSELFKVACRFECDSPVLIHDPATAGHLYRIAQEAVGNAIKHGKAKNILIRLDANEANTILSIKDDGLGLPEPLPKNRGLGLRIMAHRASMIGGKFSARREKGGGTLATCELAANPGPKSIRRE